MLVGRKICESQSRKTYNEISRYLAVLYFSYEFVNMSLVADETNGILCRLGSIRL